MALRDELIEDYGELAFSIIITYWDKWVNQRILTLEQFKDDLTLFYAKNKIPYYQRISSQRINKLIREYATHNNVYFDCNGVVTIGGISKKCKLFKQK